MHRSIPTILKPEPVFAQPLKKQKETKTPEVCMPTPRLVSLRQLDNGIDKPEVTSSVSFPSTSVKVTDLQQTSLHPALTLESEHDFDLLGMPNLTQTVTYLDQENSSRNYARDLSTAHYSKSTDTKAEVCYSSANPSSLAGNQEYEVVINDSLTDDENSLTSPSSLRPLSYHPLPTPASSLSTVQDVNSDACVSTTLKSMETGDSRDSDVITEAVSNYWPSRTHNKSVVIRSTERSKHLRRRFILLLDGSLAMGPCSSIELEGHMVDQAISNVMALPKLFTEVMHMQQGQHNEIQRQLVVLQNAQKRLQNVSDYNENIRQEAGTVTNQICAIQDATKNLDKVCKRLENEIKELVSSCESLRASFKEGQRELEAEDRELEECIDRMKSYKETVETYEFSQQLMIDLKQQEYTVGALKRKRKAIDTSKVDVNLILNGSMEAKLTEAISQLKEDIKLQEEFLQEKDTAIQNLKDKGKQVEQSTHVLNKRNAAQLTRLKRQLKEANLRNKRWQEQLTLLQSSIDDLQRKLEE